MVADTKSRKLRYCFNFILLAASILLFYYSLHTYGPLVIDDHWKINLQVAQGAPFLQASKPPNEQPPQRWLGCPKAGDGLNSIMVTSYFHGRLGNQIWEYLSAWAVARHYGVWPVVPNVSLHELKTVFEDLSVPSLEELAQRCNFSDQIEEMQNHPQGIGNQEELLRHIEEPRPYVLNYFRLPVYVVLTEESLPWWRELRREMRIKAPLREYAQQLLHNIYLRVLNRSSIIAQNNINKAVEETTTFEKNDTLLPLQYVGVHVRRTDYLNHVVNNYPGAKAFDERFFLHSMEWLRNRLKRPLAFVVVSDDLDWCYENFNASDVFIVGNGNETSPGEDLALLAACNHTIFAYGTFGLSAAMLANGQYTLLYDTQNNTNTKEMEFATYLPGWHIFDDEGKEHYKPAQRPFKFTYVKG